VRHYLYSGGSWSWLGDDIFLGRLRIAQVTGSGTRYFHVDHLGSVRRVSTGAGALEKAYDFFPYGLPVKETVGQERLWFASYELEHQNTPDYTDDLYFLHARWYFPYMARFLSPDPVRGDPAQPQSLNLFAYVTDNPLNFVDPWGLAAEAAMPPSSTIDESQRDGVCSGVSSDPDCPRFHEEVEAIGRASGGPSVDLGAYSSTQDLKNYYAWLAMQNRAAFSGSTITAHGFWRRVKVVNSIGFQAFAGFGGVLKLPKPVLKFLPGLKNLAKALKAIPLGFLVQLEVNPETKVRSLQIRAASGLGAYIVGGWHFSAQDPAFSDVASSLGFSAGGGEGLAISVSLESTGPNAGAFNVILGGGWGLGGASVDWTSAPLLSREW
jgi:RHS repeat-associated protein